MFDFKEISLNGLESVVVLVKKETVIRRMPVHHIFFFIVEQFWILYSVLIQIGQNNISKNISMWQYGVSQCKLLIISLSILSKFLGIWEYQVWQRVEVPVGSSSYFQGDSGRQQGANKLVCKQKR